MTHQDNFDGGVVWSEFGHQRMHLVRVRVRFVAVSSANSWPMANEQQPTLYEE